MPKRQPNLNMAIAFQHIKIKDKGGQSLSIEKHETSGIKNNQ